jgi:transcriptional regulator with XRE-family HTH domain
MRLRIKEIRKLKSMSGRDFAMSIGIDNSQYSKIESGKLMPTIQHLMEISSKYNVSIDWLLTGDGQMLKSGGGDAVVTDSIYNVRKERSSPPSADISLLLDRQEKLIRENERLRIENENLKAKSLRRNASYDYCTDPFPSVAEPEEKYKLA